MRIVPVGGFDYTLLQASGRMMALNLTPEEAEMLREILKSDHDSLLLELSRTDSLAYKDVVRPREALVARLLDELTPDGRDATTAGDRART